jgi:hypothetical protein
MQKWLSMGIVFCLTMAAPMAQAETAQDVQAIKGPDGATLAVMVQCNSCAAPTAASKKCNTGSEEGYLNGQPCGKCMITENYGASLPYPYDLHFTGILVDADGKPVKDRFVKVFMANGWTVRTRTGEDGAYRLMLGATAERKSNTPVLIDLGRRVDSPKDNKDYYSMFLLQEGYKTCPASAKPHPKEQKGKQSKSSKKS